MLLEVMSNCRLHRPLPRQVTRQDLGLDRRCVDYLGLAHGFSFPSFDLEVALDLARSLSNIGEFSTCSPWRSHSQSAPDRQPLGSDDVGVHELDVRSDENGRHRRLSGTVWSGEDQRHRRRVHRAFVCGVRATTASSPKLAWMTLRSRLAFAACISRSNRSAMSRRAATSRSLRPASDRCGRHRSELFDFCRPSGSRYFTQ